VGGCPDQPEAVKAARGLLLRDPADLSDEERGALHDFVRARVDQARLELEANAPWEARLRLWITGGAWLRWSLTRWLGSMASLGRSGRASSPPLACRRRLRNGRRSTQHRQVERDRSLAGRQTLQPGNATCAPGIRTQNLRIKSPLQSCPPRTLQLADVLFCLRRSSQSSPPSTQLNADCG
jgi:hypothetical protein